MFCDEMKEFLSQKGVPYADRDVTKDKQALQELIQLGYRTTPVAKINGEVIVGFDRERLEALLE